MKFNRKDKTLETERLQLRLFTAADAEQVRSLCDNFTIFKTTLNMPYPYSLECALSWMANHERNFTEDKLYELAITNKNNGQLYGAIALSNQRLHQNGEMAYWIGKPFWGNGYATEAARAMLEFAFEEKTTIAYMHDILNRILPRAEFWRNAEWSTKAPLKTMYIN